MVSNQTKGRFPLQFMPVFTSLYFKRAYEKQGNNFNNEFELRKRKHKQGVAT